MSSMRVSLWAISAGDERALNHWWRIKNVGDGQKKRAYCYYTVRPVRFIAIQLLIVLPAHPWKLFRTAIHFPTIRRIVQLSSWRFILHHPDAVPQSSWPACYPNWLSISVLEVSFTSILKCPWPTSCGTSFITLPECVPSSFPKQHHPDVSCSNRLPFRWN